MRIAIGLAGCLLAWVALPARAQSGHLPLEPQHDSGQSVTPAYEGWFKNPDGGFSMLFGYYNRNLKEELDIPVGPNNRIEPGEPDQGQPTHFMPRRQWGVFTVTVPPNFGTGKLTWTLITRGQTNVVPAGLDPLWEVEPFKEVMGNTPPAIRLEEGGPSVQGPRAISKTLTTKLPDPVTLTVWVADDAATFPGTKPPKTPPVTLTWGKFRGPGTVTFSNAKPAVEKGESTTAAFSGKATTTATFSEPGEYVLRLVANDWSGDGGRGFQCCWTNAQVRVSVQPGTTDGR